MDTNGPSVNTDLTRAALVERLAHVSHRSWMRQKKRNDGIVGDPDDPTPTQHDYERAEDIVAELTRLGIWRDPE
jgi:hypothetical protein